MHATKLFSTQQATGPAHMCIMLHKQQCQSHSAGCWDAADKEAQPTLLLSQSVFCIQNQTMFEVVIRGDPAGLWK